jgi:hypothetical protein
MFSLADGRAAVRDSALWLLANFTNAKCMDSAVPGTHVRLGLTYRNYDKAIA